MQAAVIPCKGMGDGLIMMVASYRLKQEGYRVTTFHDTLGELAPWFPGQVFAKRSALTELASFDRIILQNENTPFAFELISKYRENVHVLYASYEEGKHLPFTDRDVLLNRSEPMVSGVARGIAAILGKEGVCKRNGLVVPDAWTLKKKAKQIAIHPMSTIATRRWTVQKFIAVARGLQKEGYFPTFCVSPEERSEWSFLLKGEFFLPELSTLSALAAHLYESSALIGNESGTGHLASNLGIPTLIVARCPKEMALWRPGFCVGKVVTPSRYIPNVKGIRLRDKGWKRWISSRAVLKAFKEGWTFQ